MIKLKNVLKNELSLELKIEIKKEVEKILGTEPKKDPENTVNIVSKNIEKESPIEIVKQTEFKPVENSPSNSNSNSSYSESNGTNMAQAVALITIGCFVLVSPSIMGVLLGSSLDSGSGLSGGLGDIKSGMSEIVNFVIYPFATVLFAKGFYHIYKAMCD